jgi:hypothetical protein
MRAPHCFCVHASAWPCTLPRICAAERDPHHYSSHHRCTGSGHGVQLRQVPRQLRHVLGVEAAVDTHDFSPPSLPYAAQSRT